SSDVCSSDLPERLRSRRGAQNERLLALRRGSRRGAHPERAGFLVLTAVASDDYCPPPIRAAIAATFCSLIVRASASARFFFSRRASDLRYLRSSSDSAPSVPGFLTFFGGTMPEATSD